MVSAFVLLQYGRDGTEKGQGIKAPPIIKI